MRKIYLVVGVLLATIGIAGFVTPSPLLGLFEVSTVHNIVHLASGALALVAAAQGIGAMRTWGRLLGPFYLAITTLGVATPEVFGLMHLNTPDNLLHVALALVFLYVGLLAPPRL